MICLLLINKPQKNKFIPNVNLYPTKMSEYSSSGNKYNVASLGKNLLQTFYHLRIKHSRTVKALTKVLIRIRSNLGVKFTNGTEVPL